MAIILFALGIEKFLQPFRCSSFGHGKRKLCKTKLTDFNAPYIFPLTVILIFEINEVSLSTLAYFDSLSVCDRLLIHRNSKTSKYYETDKSLS